MAVDPAKVADAVRALLAAIGEDPARLGLAATPDRVGAAADELFAGYAVDPAGLLEPLPGERATSAIFVKDVEVISFCEHHLLPFIGTALVGYLPGEDGRICGLSKLSRLVDALSRRLQVQERLVAEIADAIETALAPKGVLVVIEAEHLCMTLRGARKPGARMVTVEARGVYERPEVRADLLRLVSGG